MADAADSKSAIERCTGSSPVFGTTGEIACDSDRIAASDPDEVTERDKLRDKLSGIQRSRFVRDRDDESVSGGNIVAGDVQHGTLADALARVSALLDTGEVATAKAILNELLQALRSW